MPTVEEESAARAIATGRPWAGAAFGVALLAPTAIETLTPLGEGPTPRDVAVWRRTTDLGSLTADWPSGATTRLVDSRYPDGAPMMSVDADESGSFLVSAPGYGTHLVSSDGCAITSVLASEADWTWQRLFSAQVLPLAAAARGLALVHASAIVHDGCGFAFTADSGCGKTSIAAHLVARGAELLTDDVLALESVEGGIRAHPGTCLLSMAPHELAAQEQGRARLGAVLGRDEDKVYLRPEVHASPAPLVALYRLRREPATASARIVEERPPSAHALLGSAFLTYLRDGRSLLCHLDVMSRLASVTRVFAVDVPGDMNASEAAAMLEQHAEGLT